MSYILLLCVLSMREHCFTCSSFSIQHWKRIKHNLGQFNQNGDCRSGNSQSMRSVVSEVSNYILFRVFRLLNLHGQLHENLQINPLQCKKHKGCTKDEQFYFANLFLSNFHFIKLHFKTFYTFSANGNSLCCIYKVQERRQRSNFNVAYPGKVLLTQFWWRSPKDRMTCIGHVKLFKDSVDISCNGESIMDKLS